MDWIQVLTVIGSTVGCCFYFRKESQADLHEIKAQVSSFSDEVKGDMKEMREMMGAFQRTFHMETKDFHGRLCTLEEKYQQAIGAKGAKSAKVEK